MTALSPYSSILSALAWALVHFIWQGCVLAAAFALTMLALRRASASTRYLAGCATLLMMALTPLATFMWVYRTNLPLATMSDAEMNGLTLLGSANAPFERVQIAIVATWFLGVLICALWVFGGWLNTRRFRRIESLTIPRDLQYRIAKLAEDLGVRCVVRVVDHLAIAAPLTLGAIKPVILLPASMLTGLSRAQLQAIIAHEMAHIRRMDFLVNLLQAALEAALFYHPAVWWVSRQVRQEREYCCDDLAAESCGNVVTYARALAQLESLRSDGPRLGLSSQGGSLMKRIARLLNADSPRTPARPVVNVAGTGGGVWTAGAGFALLIAASSAVALVKPPVQPQPEPAQLQEVVVEGQPIEVRGENISLVWRLAEGAADLQQAPVEIEGQPLGEWAGNVVGGVDLFVVDCEPQTIEVSGRLRLADALRFVAQPQIDPEHMPSDGLVQAAKLAYPFNLLQLMPWVAPEAHDVLIKPEMEIANQTLLRLVGQRFAATELRVVPTLRDLPLVQATRRADARVRMLSLIEAMPCVAATEAVPAQSVTGDSIEFSVELAPALFEATNVVAGRWVGGVSVPAAKSVPAEKAKPAETTEAQPSQPKP